MIFSPFAKIEPSNYVHAHQIEIRQPLEIFNSPKFGPSKVITEYEWHNVLMLQLQREVDKIVLKGEADTLEEDIDNETKVRENHLQIIW